MDLKTIALDLGPAVAERREFKWGTNDELWGIGRSRRGQRVLDGCQWDDGLFGCLAGRNEASGQS